MVRKRIAAAVLVCAGLAAAGSMRGAALAQPAVSAPPAAPAKDYDQRSLQIYEFRKAAKDGPARGQEIFYYKCWFCHNEFTKDVPKLTGLFQHATLLDGQPVTEEAVKNQIRNGSANMASYKYSLSDADLNDLIGYLRDRCCWNSDTPPSNPAYIAH